MGWQFLTYVSSTGRRDVQKTIDRLSTQAEERFLAELRWLFETPIGEWHEPRAKKLRGYDDLYEMRFVADKKQIRPIGYFGPSPNQFTILIWASHKQNVYTPQDALDSAERRRKEIRGGRGTVAPIQVAGEGFPPDEGQPE